MLRRLSAVFAILVGVGIIATWARWWAAGTIPELDLRPVRTGFHIGAELVTATALIAGGIGLLAGRRWAMPVHLGSLGLAIYASIEGAGHYAATGDGAMAAVTAATGLVAAAAIWLAVSGR